MGYQRNAMEVHVLYMSVGAPMQRQCKSNKDHDRYTTKAPTIEHPYKASQELVQHLNCTTSIRVQCKRQCKTNTCLGLFCLVRSDCPSCPTNLGDTW